MTTSIYFIRHGKVYNPTDVLYGRLPRFGLAEEGIKQIEQTAAFLAEESIDYLYSSPILRARQTAEIIQKKLGLPKMYISKYLIEVLTSMQGKSSSYVHSLNTNFDIFAGPHNDIQGETIIDVATRVEKFIAYILKNHAGKKVVAVTHGDLLMLLKAQAEKLPIVIGSIRPGENKYVQQGEIYKLSCNETELESLQSVFKPK